MTIFPRTDPFSTREWASRRGSRADRRQPFGHAAGDATAIDQGGNPTEQLVLFDLIGSPIHGPAEHILPMGGQHLRLECDNIERRGIIDDSYPALWGDELDDLCQMVLGVGGREKTKPGASDAEGGIIRPPVGDGSRSHGRHRGLPVAPGPRATRRW